MALKLVHTADWHLGMRFPSFDPGDRDKLTRARLAVVDRILGVAERHGADAVLCAGDLFDEPAPAREWWQGLADKLAARERPEQPVFLLPGNHDPLTESSLWAPDHAFRGALPPWVHVVDRDDFSYQLGPEAVLHAVPCRSQAGQQDLALRLPDRAPGDERIRVGMVHGQTFDIEGCQTNFPIARDAAARRGLDYLAIGDTHNYREVPNNAGIPTVYPGAPEPTKFGEPGAGSVAVAFFPRRRRPPIVRPEGVAQWTWSEQRCRSLGELRALHDRGPLDHHVVRLALDMKVPAAEYDEAEQILASLKGTSATHGRIGVLQIDRGGLELDTTGIETLLGEVPEVLRSAVAALKRQEATEDTARARRALVHLYRLVKTERGA